MRPINFKIDKKIKGKLGRAGVISTPHGDIQTPSFIVVGTKATVKALSTEQVYELGTEAVLANTYHLYLQPGDEIVKKAGGLHKFMNWDGPTFTDSGGFQAFSLGAAFGTGIKKLAQADENTEDDHTNNHNQLAKIDEEGVTFSSHIDGSKHKFTPEKSIEIQNNLGADIIFAFDECTSPTASEEYQKEAMDRTHRWARQSLDFHRASSKKDEQGIFGIVQGGRHEDLRRESAKIIGGMDFDGYGIGGSFNKNDIDTAVGWVNRELPEDKPRHLLGIGEPEDLFGAIENGVDTFDCVAPTRMARNGTLYTASGKINIRGAKFKEDFTSIDEGCGCYTCKIYTRAYINHLFRANEMMSATLASIHNLYFIVNLVKKIRQSILDENFDEFRENFLITYQGLTV